MNEQETRSAVQAGINDAVSNACKGAMIGILLFFALIRPMLALLIVAVVLPPYAVIMMALSKNNTTSRIGCFVLKLAAYATCFGLIFGAVWLFSPTHQ
jgi:uncharacterized membrane protein